MVKSKKFLSAIVALLLALCAFALFGCEGTTTEQVYQKMQNFVTKTEQETSFIDAYNSFKNFQKYNENGLLETIDESQQTMVQVVMNYLKTNVWQFEDYTQNHNYADLEQKLTLLDEAFVEAQERYDDMTKSAPNSSNFVYYNGFAIAYQKACIDFINKAYDFALSMQNTLINDMKLLDFDFASITVDQANFYLSTVKLSLADDCRLFLLDSCKGEKVEGNNHYDSVTEWIKLVQDISSVSVTNNKGERYVALRELEQILVKERSHLKEALSQFSFYDYQNVYKANINSYANNLENADVYLDTINNYFYETLLHKDCYLSKFINQINAIY